jgi:hypothetical protein
LPLTYGPFELAYVVATEDPAEILAQGAKAWNAWRKKNPQPLVFAQPQWYGSPIDPDQRVQVKGRNRVDFRGLHFSDITILKPFAEARHVEESVWENCAIDEGDFSRAHFTGATFRNTRFNKTIFTDAVFAGATFINGNLNRVNLVGATFTVKEITETIVYGISAWDLQLSEETKQSKLVIEKTYELYSELVAQGKALTMVDDIELAQFVFHLSKNKKLRDTLNILNDRSVLILGKFRDGGQQRLDTIREWLRARGYMPMIFDFVRPEGLSLTETVVTMAGLAKFVIADLSGSSVAAELQPILSQIKKPLVVFGQPYALLPDIEDQTSLITIRGTDATLLHDLEERLPAIEKLHSERIVRLAARYAPPS